MNDSQHDEMCRITAELENNHKNQLEGIYKGAGLQGGSHVIKDLWRADNEQAHFYKD